MIGARFGEVGELALRLDDHQVHIERLVRAQDARGCRALTHPTTAQTNANSAGDGLGSRSAVQVIPAREPTSPEASAGDDIAGPLL